MSESKDKEEKNRADINSEHEGINHEHENLDRASSSEAREDLSESHEGASRRAFLKGTAGGLLVTALASNARAAFGVHNAPLSSQQNAAVQFQGAPSNARLPVETLAPVASLPPNLTRIWLGQSFWANRLQDWRLHDGRIECVAGAAGSEVRSVAVLTREIVRGRAAGTLSVRAGILDDAGGGGFCGFLIGAGGTALDHRAAALVQKASGENGGLLCTYEADGRVRFREHTSESQPLAFNELSSSEATTTANGNVISKEVRLELNITPQNDGRFTLQLTAHDKAGDSIVAKAVRRDVAESELVGGIALVSSPTTGKAGARYWFNDLRTGGAKIAERPARALGPILGTLYSLNGNVLKLSAQLMPIGDAESQTVKLQYRAAEGSVESNAGAWRDAATSRIEGGWTALFRLPDWDSSRDWEYRVVYDTNSTQPSSNYYTGLIRRDPVNKESLTVGMINCVAASYRSLEGGGNRAELPKAESLGRYTHKSLYFPHRELAQNAAYHNSDLLVFPGDQFYEGSPTHPENHVAPTLDYLYKWYLWIWSFRELTRNTPAILMVDDHDMYQGNIWGNGGRAAPEGDQNRGGYVCRPEWVNMVHRTQCSHNPDPFDPTPIDQGITVYYGAFRYGGVSFAIIEDRKFKTAPLQGTDLDVHEAELLGARQEKFLEAWARDRRSPNEPKICFTQTLWACVQTSPRGKPMLDFDANGYPKYNRDRAIRLLREANALLLAGDQHLASIVRHGVDGYADGVLQFTGPAGGTSWARWFEPAEALPNAREGLPHTGNFEDAFGNRVRVLAVANPKISFAEYRKYNKGRGQNLGDRKLKSDGYAIVRVNKRERDFTLECWPWNADMRAGSAKQYPGWPMRVSFDEVGGSKTNS